jgi:hypothetical protein
MKTLHKPVFVSRNRFVRRGKIVLQDINCPWALDSGGFTELSMHGRWTITAAQYVNIVRVLASLGQMRWAAIMDWMCEDVMLKMTGKTVLEHQTLTVNNYLDLMYLDPTLPWVPVLQGYYPEDYKRHLTQYNQAGFDLSSLPLVGIGSVCRRQKFDEIHVVTHQLKTNHHIKLHGFGLSIPGLMAMAPSLVSADSMAWSQRARRERWPMLSECTHSTCSSCILYASHWRFHVLSRLSKIK